MSQRSLCKNSKSSKRERFLSQFNNNKKKTRKENIAFVFFCDFRGGIGERKYLRFFLFFISRSAMGLHLGYGYG